MTSTHPPHDRPGPRHPSGEGGPPGAGPPGPPGVPDLPGVPVPPDVPDPPGVPDPLSMPDPPGVPHPPGVPVPPSAPDPPGVPDPPDPAVPPDPVPAPGADRPGSPDRRGPEHRPAPVDLPELAELERLDGLSGPDDLAGLLGTGPAPGLVLRLTGNADLVAALPTMLGFHPEESLVLVGFAGRTGARAGLTVRADLPAPSELDAVCAQAVTALVSDVPDGAAAVLVGGGVPGPGGRPPRRDVAAAVQRALVEAGIEPYTVLWAAGTAAGLPWACYDVPGQDCACRGVVPGPRASAMASAVARRGRAVLPDRAALGEVLAGDSARALRRRSRLRAAAVAAAADGAGTGGPEPDRTDGHRVVLRRALDDAAACRLAVDDRTVLDFCAAFDVPGVRDDAVRVCLGPDAPAAEQLWAALTRAMPEPERAHPAALFAVCALLRGDGALAAMAVARAFDALPGHRLARIVDAALRDFTGPVGLRRALERDYGRP